MALLQSVWQKLSGKSKKTASPDTIANQALLLTPVLELASANTAAKKILKESISDQYQPLWQLLNKRQILEVKVDGSNLGYQTLIMAIDIQRGLLWLDDLFPSQHLLETGDRITLRHHRNGEQLSFSSPIVAWGNQYGAHGLAIMLPEELNYQPRRQFRRANLMGRPSLSVKVRAIGQEISYGSVLDLSNGGLKVSVPGNMLSQLRHGALLPLCELNLSNELTLRCSARVRAFRLLRSPHRNTQISLEFVDMPAEQQQYLQQFVNNLLYLQQSDDMHALRSA